jgi:hypothetical protein
LQYFLLQITNDLVFEFGGCLANKQSIVLLKEKDKAREEE